MSAEFVFPASTLWFRSQVMAAAAAPEQDAMVVVHASFINLAVTMINRDESALPRSQVLVPTLESGAKMLAVAVVCDEAIVRVAAGDDQGCVHFFQGEFCADQSVPVFKQSRVHQKQRELESSEKLDRASIESLAFVRGERGMRLVSGGFNGRVIAWDYDVNSFHVFTAFGRGKSVNIIRPHPFKVDCVALGFRKGDVVMALLKGKGEVLRRFQAGHFDVQDISFRPKANGDDEDACLFAVGTLDGNVTVFNEQSAVPVANWHVSPGRKNDAKEVTSVSWQSSNTLLTKGRNGVLMKWDMSELNSSDSNERGAAKNLKLESSQVHDEHPKKLFTICTASNLPFVVTSGLDRKLVIFDIDRNVIRCVLPTLGHQVICMVSSPVEPSLIAIASFDCYLRIWKTGSNVNGFDVQQVPLPDKTKVLALAFHPEKETELAFSTEDGKIGFLPNVFNQNRMLPKFDSHRHDGAIYTLLFAPRSIAMEDLSEGNAKESHALYCVCSGKIFVHEPWRNNFSPIGLKLPNKDRTEGEEDANISELAFTSDCDYMAVGYNSGLIDIFLISGDKRTLTLTCTLHASNKSIQALSFHPKPQSENVDGKGDNNLDDIRLWLAASSKSKDVVVFKVGSHIKEVKNSPPKLISIPDLTLVAHKQRAISFDWHPRRNGLLVSASYDYTAKVWDCIEGTCIATYNGHSSRVRCCLWSPQEENMVFTGAQDSSVHAWDIRKQVIKDKEQQKVFKGKYRNVNRDEKTEVDGAFEATRECETKEPMVTKMKEISSSAPNENRRFVVKRSMFPLQQKAENGSTPQHCLQLFNSLHGDGNASDYSDKTNRVKIDSAALATFLEGDEDLTAVLHQEINRHKTDHQLDMACDVSLLTSDIGSLVRLAISKGNLTPLILTAAAGCSYSLWMEATEAYAKQLIGQGNFGMAASHYLIIHKPIEAVKAFEEGKMFRAAVAVAKLHLSPKSELVKSLYSAWGCQAQNDGNYVLASKCFVACNDLKRASAVLAMLNTKDALGVAALFSLEAKDEERAKVLAAKCQLMHDLEDRDIDAQDVLLSVQRRLEDNLSKANEVAGVEQ